MRTKIYNNIESSLELMEDLLNMDIKSWNRINLSNSNLTNIDQTIESALETKDLLKKIGRFYYKNILIKIHSLEEEFESLNIADNKFNLKKVKHISQVVEHISNIFDQSLYYLDTQVQKIKDLEEEIN